ncbi:MAG: hypothetical protein IKU97_05900 [Tidjanibacter sp.]|nr:hypothetical protein [Tidjanibacter sp.]
MILKFRMVCDENENFVRDYEVDAAMTLLDLNDFICEDLDYDTDGMTSFFLADERWRKVREFTVMDMGGGMDSEEAPLPMADVKLGQIIRTLDDRLIWVFDIFGDRAYFLELLEPKMEEAGMEYPRVQFAHGEPVDQYDAEASAGSGSKSIFDEMMDEFGDFGGDDSYDDEY